MTTGVVYYYVCAFILKSRRKSCEVDGGSRSRDRHVRLPSHQAQAQVVATDTEPFGSRGELHFASAAVNYTHACDGKIIFLLIRIYNIPLHLFACVFLAAPCSLNSVRTEALGINGQRGNEMVCISSLAGSEVCKCAYVALLKFYF